MLRRALPAFAVAAGLAAAASAGGAPPAEGAEEAWELSGIRPAPRAQQLAELRRGGFDVLIIGGTCQQQYRAFCSRACSGGATGTGAALDAATRGLRTALVEADDFSAGTSSRSTKLVHGGVRYLEKAVAQRDLGQLKLVFEALHERTHFLKAAPHLTNPIPTVMPCYRWWEAPYFWAGLKAYDLIAAGSAISWSHFQTAAATSAIFPTLATQRAGGETLKGSVRDIFLLRVRLC